MKVAVVFDTPHGGWRHDDFQREMAAQGDEPEAEYEVARALATHGHEVQMIGVREDLRVLLDALDAFKPDLAFNCAEGFRGDCGLDYVLATALEAARVAYTGSPPEALLVTRDKALSKKVLAWHNLRVPGFVTFHPGTPLRAPERLVYPLIVKPVAEDASAGIARASVVRDERELADRVAFIQATFAQPAIAEEFIEGRELYVGVIGNGETLEVLPVVEMVFDKEKNPPEERIATKHAKWHDGYRERRGIRNQFARPIAQSAREEIERLCRTAAQALHLRDYARFDLRLTDDQEVWLIEANANPYISWGHDMANAAEKRGLDYAAFINRIAQEASNRRAVTA
jgi:D-alanine-D-alanine ligase